MCAMAVSLIPGKSATLWSKSWHAVLTKTFAWSNDPGKQFSFHKDKRSPPKDQNDRLHVQGREIHGYTEVKRSGRQVKRECLLISNVPVTEVCFTILEKIIFFADCSVEKLSVMKQRARERTTASRDMTPTFCWTSRALARASRSFRRLARFLRSVSGTLGCFFSLKEQQNKLWEQVQELAQNGMALPSLRHFARGLPKGRWQNFIEKLFIRVGIEIVAMTTTEASRRVRDLPAAAALALHCFLPVYMYIERSWHFQSSSSMKGMAQDILATCVRNQTLFQDSCLLSIFVTLV